MAFYVVVVPAAFYFFARVFRDAGPEPGGANR